MPSESCFDCKEIYDGRRFDGNYQAAAHYYHTQLSEVLERNAKEIRASTDTIIDQRVEITNLKKRIHGMLIDVMEKLHQK